jgi:hypothetical protein
MSESRLLPAVLSDIAMAAQWYDVQGYPGLGNRFVDVFYFYVRHIQQYGRAYARVYAEFHRILLKPFPYAAYYRYHDDLVVVSLVITPETHAC